MKDLYERKNGRSKPLPYENGKYRGIWKEMPLPFENPFFRFRVFFCRLLDGSICPC